MILWDKLKNEMLRHPRKTMSENNAFLTYEEIVIFAEQFSEQLRKEKCCAILCNNEMATAMAILSCFAAGVTAVPLSLRYGEIHCKKILENIKPTALITDLGGELNIIEFQSDGYIQQETHPAVIMCTSGTTGTPKGVMLSEENILANAKDILEYFNINANDRILICRPIYHCAVLTGEFITSLIMGLDIVFYSEKFEPAKILRLIKEHNISVFGGTPTILNLLAVFNRSSERIPLRIVSVSGEQLSKTVATKISKAFPDAQIYNVYGLTEACPRVSYLPSEYFEIKPESVGIVLKNVKAKIVLAHGEIAQAYEEGLLWVKGPNIMLGYYNDPEATQNVLKDDWLCTGDIAMMDADGFIYIRGRNDDLIIRGGMNIYPADIECSVKTDVRTKDVFVYGYEERGIVKIGMRISGNYDTVEDVQKMCDKTLSPYQRPSKIELMDELPKNGSGKIIRQKERKR